MAAADDAVSRRGVVGHFDLRRIVVQAAAELTDGDPALGIEPRAVRPLERLARHSQDARRCDALQHREVGVVGFHVVQRRDIRILRQQGGLQPAHRNFAGRAPFPAAMAANVPAACPVSRTTGCRRVEPLIRFETDIALSETTRLSVPAGIITPIGTENDGTGGKGIFPI